MPRDPEGEGYSLVCWVKLSADDDDIITKKAKQLNMRGHKYDGNTKARHGRVVADAVDVQEGKTGGRVKSMYNTANPGALERLIKGKKKKFYAIRA